MTIDFSRAGFDINALFASSDSTPAGDDVSDHVATAFSASTTSNACHCNSLAVKVAQQSTTGEQTNKDSLSALWALTNPQSGPVTTPETARPGSNFSAQTRASAWPDPVLDLAWPDPVLPDPWGDPNIPQPWSDPTIPGPWSDPEIYQPWDDPTITEAWADPVLPNAGGNNSTPGPWADPSLPNSEGGSSAPGSWPDPSLPAFGDPALPNYGGDPSIPDAWPDPTLPDFDGNPIKLS